MMTEISTGLNAVGEWHSLLTSTTASPQLHWILAVFPLGEIVLAVIDDLFNSLFYCRSLYSSCFLPTRQHSEANKSTSAANCALFVNGL